jgi:hypothetical protein
MAEAPVEDRKKYLHFSGIGQSIKKMRLPAQYCFSKVKRKTNTDEKVENRDERAFTSVCKLRLPGQGNEVGTVPCFLSMLSLKVIVNGFMKQR